MSDDNTTYPYTLTVTSSEKRAGHFEWAIRKHGKLVQRSDRLHHSEQSAQVSGQEALERLIREDRQPNRPLRS
jgi:hypothetical protein